MNADTPLIQIRSLTKSYDGVRALDGVSLDLARSEIHALCGENGAGKSTLIRILAGIVRPDSGHISLSGQEFPAGSVSESEAAGVAVMHQESTAFPDLNAVDNLFVGRELTRCAGLLLDYPAMQRKTEQLLQTLGVRLDLRKPVGELPLAQRQMVALARAMLRDCRLLIMDEPTASLSHRETVTLLQILRQLQASGVTILYVSHRLDEIFQIADRVSVLRDGRHVATHPIAETTREQLIRDMVGRAVEGDPRPVRKQLDGRPTVLEVCGLTRHGCFYDIDFQIRAGEIVGLTGLAGAGRSEIARAVFGIDPVDAGSVSVAGKQLKQGSVDDAMTAGIGMVPEDRQHEGLILPMTAGENLCLASLRLLTRYGLLQKRQMSAAVRTQILQLGVRAASEHVDVSTLSGGNQQKVVLGKWLMRQPKVLILDEPTRGVDVGAKSQVHQLVHELASQGMATLVISSDLPELLSLCDRMLVIRSGRMAGELDSQSATQEAILSLALPAEEENSRPQTDPAEIRATTGSGTIVSAAGEMFRRVVRYREAGLLLLILTICVLVGLKDPNFLSADVWRDIFVRSAPTAIVACGVMLVVVIGEVDISVGSLMALLAAVMGRMISTDHANLPCWVGLPVMLLLGTAIGLVTGFLVSAGRVPSIIVTLGLLTALRGLTTFLMSGENIDGLPEALTQVTKQGLLGVPLSLMAAASVIAVTSVAIHQTAVGRQLFALGSSRESAAMAGLNSHRLRLLAFGYTGFLTALATLVEVPRLPTIESGIGSEFELLVVTCVVVGGVAVSGGRGRITGVLAAVLLMTMIRPVLTFLDFGEAGEKWTRSIQGLFILLAVIADTVAGRRVSGAGGSAE